MIGETSYGARYMSVLPSLASLVVRPARPSDDNAAARLLLEASDALDQIFRDRPFALRVASAAFRSAATAVSHRRTLVAERDGAAVGQVVRFPGEDWARLRVRTGLSMMWAAGRRAATLVWRGRSFEAIMPPLLDDEVFIMSFAVLPEHRSQGIGGRLLREVFAEAKRAGRRAVSVDVEAWNENAIRMYEREGFRRVSAHACPAGNGVRDLSSLRLVRPV
jgi:ribosomal protein S18 acetylase RimI-like enzyme